MIEPVENKFKGKCPLCGGQLIRDNDILDCRNGDYTAKVSDFEAAWSKHAAALNTALAILLTELKDANLKI